MNHPPPNTNRQQVNQSMQLGIVMDSIESINIKKDSSLAMLLSAGRRGWQVEYMTLGDLFVRDGVAFASSALLHVDAARIDALLAGAAADPDLPWYTLSERRVRALGELDVILMRKDPPFDMEFVYATYILERAQVAGAMIVNDPRSLRDCNEKFFTAWFAEHCPPTLVCRQHAQLQTFIAEHGDIIVKPLDGMGGASIFRVSEGDPNTNVIFETLTRHETRYCMAQRFVPQISDGDKRVLVVAGKPVDYMLARIPSADDARGNLAAGATAEGRPLGAAERRIAESVGPELVRRGILFAGLDIIGDRLTEVNVTSPTCIRELDAQFGTDIAGSLLDAVEAHR